MKSLIAAVALLLCITPALAQNAQEPSQSTPAPQATPAVTADAQQAPPAANAPGQPTNEQQQPQQQVQQQPDSQAQQPQAEQAPQQQPYPDGAPQRSTLRRRPLQVSPAVRPRPEAAAYPASSMQAQFSVGARLLSADEVKQRFSTPLGKKYLVVEVGFFPAEGQTIKLRTENFALQPGGDDQAFFPATPRDIASALGHATNPGYSRIYPSVGVGTWGRGVSTGVGVGAGPYGRSRLGGSAGVMEDELTDKGFPEGAAAEPVAGYLYFPVSGKPAKKYNLEFFPKNGAMISLALPEVKK